MTGPIVPLVYTPAEAAQLRDISKSQMLYLIERRCIPTISRMPGARTIRIPRWMIDAILDGRPYPITLADRPNVSSPA